MIGVTTETAEPEADAENLPSEDVVRLVAARAGVDPIELEPLYDAIDPEALNEVVASGATEVRFDYAGYRIVVDERTVTIEE